MSVKPFSQIVLHGHLSIVASVTVTLSSSGENIAGVGYNLTCTAVIIGSSDMPIITWNRTEANNMLSHGNGTYSKLLQFDPLQASHEDVYMCQVKIVDVVREELINVTVQSKFNLFTDRH